MRKQQNRPRGTNRANLWGAAAAALRLNQMSIDWTRFMLHQTALAHNFQQDLGRLSSFAVAAVSASQTQAGGLLELMGRSIRVKADLLQRASSAAQAPSLPERHTRWLDFWMEAFRLAQFNAGALGRINSQALNAWLRLVAQHS